VPVSPQHLNVTVRDLPSNLKLGSVELEKLKERYKTDVLDRFKGGGYELEPGVEYDEVVTMIVPRGMYSVSAEMDLGDDYEVDQTGIAKVE